ncbi:flagellar basal body P-ring protein FlgI [Planctomycetota bacterium]|nr:flagellar basal body P-ring protein FlgI [Planctomycetota bacterium]
MQSKMLQKLIAFCMLVGLILTCSNVHAVQIQDITRIKGSESSVIIANGLVVGLNGTGDGGKFDATNRALAQTIAHLTDETVTASEMSKSKNVALVALTAKIPASGVREGDEIDVTVSAIGSAKSLENGRLFLTPMIGPYQNAPIFAYAQGRIHVNPDNPATGVVYGGAALTKSIMTNFLDEYGNITLILDEQHASMDIAVLIAEQINAVYSPDEYASEVGVTGVIAWAEGAKSVKVRVPQEYRHHVPQFLAKVQSIYIPPDFIRGQAKVYINTTTETIAIDGAVQFSPNGISHKGLKIALITPAPKASEFNPTVEEQTYLALMPKDNKSAQLQDLIDIFNQIKVPTKDQIDIIKAIHKSGNIHAKVIID